jgi:hypothetical protein
MANDDYSQRASKGQALNLAVAVAIADGKQDDMQFIVKQYYKYYKFAALLQSASVQDVVDVIENPKLEELFSKLQEELNK